MQLKTKRLILRKPKKSDWKDVVEGVGEYDVAKTTEQIPHPYKRKDAVKWISKTIKNWGKESFPFFIELKKEKKVIGCIDIHHINKTSNKASTGSWVNKKYWRNGYMTEAKIAANDFAFNELKLRKLNSKVFTSNEASNATQRKMGYVLEGMQRQESTSLASGKVHDCNIYGLLKEDWEKAKVKLL